MHKTIRKVTQDIDALKANTAIAALMTLVNQLSDNGCNRAELKTLLTLLSPFAPHMTDELWQQHGFEGYCSVAPWPSYDEDKCRDAEVEMAIQINGKLRSTVKLPADSRDEDVAAAAQQDEKVRRALETGVIRKVIVVKNKLVNLIIK